MALDLAAAAIIASIVRILIALFILWVYYKNKNKFALYIGLFFLLLGFHGIFRTLSQTTGVLFWFFLHRISLLFAAAAILYGLGRIDVEWMRKLRLVPIFAFIAVLLAYYDTYVKGGFAGETTSIIPAFAIAGISLLLAAYYFNLLGKALPRHGRLLMVVGLALQGLLLIFVGYIIQKGMSWLGFLLGMAFTGIVGLGFGCCLHHKEESLKTKSGNKAELG